MLFLLYIKLYMNVQNKNQFNKINLQQSSLFLTTFSYRTKKWTHISFLSQDKFHVYTFYPLVCLSKIFSKKIKPLYSLKESNIFSSTFYNLWDYSRNPSLFKDLICTTGMNSIIEQLLRPLFINAFTAIMLREHIVELTIKNIWSFRFILTFLKNTIFFKNVMLYDIFARETVFEKKKVIILYNFLSEITNTRFFLRIVLEKSFLMVTCSDLFLSAGWAERECWDMLGVMFLGNMDLRRILTDYGFSGHPLRKEFPLTGFIEVRYNDSVKRIVFEPVELSQELRFFDFSNPWNHATNLPGSEALMKFKSPQGGDLNFFGILSNQPSKNTFLIKNNFLIKNVFLLSGYFTEYIRNYNTIIRDSFNVDCLKIFSPKLFRYEDSNIYLLFKTMFLNKIIHNQENINFSNGWELKLKEYYIDFITSQMMSDTSIKQIYQKYLKDYAIRMFINKKDIKLFCYFHNWSSNYRVNKPSETMFQKYKRFSKESLKSIKIYDFC